MSPVDRVLGEPVNWAAFTHRELYDQVHADNEPAQAAELAKEWTDLGAELAEASDNLAGRIIMSESGWQGPAAEAARAATLDLAVWGRSAAVTAGELGDRVAALGDTAEMAKRNMPEPDDFDADEVLRQGFTTGGFAGLVKALGDVRAHSDRATAAHEQAVRVMTEASARAQEIDDDTPEFHLPGEVADPDGQDALTMTRLDPGFQRHTEPSAALAAAPGSSTGWSLPADRAVAPGAAPTPPPTHGATAPSHAPSYGPPYAPPSGTPQPVAPPNSQPYSPPHSPQYSPPYSPPPVTAPSQAMPSDGPPTVPSPGSGHGPVLDRYPQPQVVPHAAPAVASTAGPVWPTSEPEKAPRSAAPVGGMSAPSAEAAAKSAGQTGRGPVASAAPFVEDVARSASRGGTPGAAGPMGGAGAGPMAGAGAGRGEEDREHAMARYIKGDNIFAVDVADLPPSVISGPPERRR
nr:similar to extensin-like protein [Lycopersicon esculentum] gi/5917664/gb/AAD55979; contains leucine-rich repeats, Pfam:PF00560; contains proline rich extensin domains, INTERPRO:IPR002965; go_process: cellular morphogenesis during differentiation [goid 0000904] / leucine-rich repeat family protein / extensin family protein [Kibdelosporangium sp. MJ126-NF4]